MHLARTTPTSDTLIDEIEVQDVYRLRQANLAGGTVIDLGGNIGIFALRALALGAERVVCVEPHPDNIDALAANLEAAGRAAQVTIIQRAVVGWKRDLAIVGAGAQAFVTEGADGDYFRIALGQPGPAHRVEPITLAEVFTLGGVGECGFLKVDIERSEFEALICTPSDILARCRRISIETNAAPPGTFGLLIEHLTETHHVETLGSARKGAYIYARRYNL